MNLEENFKWSLTDHERVGSTGRPREIVNNILRGRNFVGGK